MVTKVVLIPNSIVKLGGVRAKMGQLDGDGEDDRAKQTS
jgi:hypothetical protein